MNREQRRTLEKCKKRMRSHAAYKLMQDTQNPLHEGERVRLNVDRIMNRKDYTRLTEEYRSFVESSRGKTFTVHLHRKRKDGFSAMIELAEQPKWLFWYDDLIRVKTGGESYQ